MHELQIGPTGNPACGRKVGADRHGGGSSFALRTLAAMALTLLACDICHAASTGLADKKIGLIDKKTATAIGLTRPHHQKLSPFVAHHAINASLTQPTARTLPQTLPAANSPKTSPQFNTTPVSLQSGHPAHMLQGLASTPIVKASPPTPGHASQFAFLPHEAVVGGTVMKHPTSMLAAIGGMARSKGIGEINGTNIRPKLH
jgi:hypothetical protein